MINKQCKHKWRISYPACIEGKNVIPAFFECEKCGVEMTSSEVIQMETLKHLVGFQKWLSILAFIVSIVAIFVAIIK